MFQEQTTLFVESEYVVVDSPAADLSSNFSEGGIS